MNSSIERHALDVCRTLTSLQNELDQACESVTNALDCFNPDTLDDAAAALVDLQAALNRVIPDMGHLSAEIFNEDQNLVTYQAIHCS